MKKKTAQFSQLKYTRSFIFFQLKSSIYTVKLVSLSDVDIFFPFKSQTSKELAMNIQIVRFFPAEWWVLSWIIRTLFYLCCHNPAGDGSHLVVSPRRRWHESSRCDLRKHGILVTKKEVQFCYLFRVGKSLFRIIVTSIFVLSSIPTNLKWKWHLCDFSIMWQLWRSAVTCPSIGRRKNIR